MPVDRYVGQPQEIRVVFPSDPLVPYGSSYASITDISMCWKKDPTTDADDAYLQKTQVGGGVVLTSGSHLFTMAISAGDYTLVTPGEYTLVLAVQISAGQPFIELEIPDPRIVVVADQHRTLDSPAVTPTGLPPLATIADLELILGRELTAGELAKAPGLLHSASVKIRAFCKGQQFVRVDDDVMTLRAQGTTIRLPQLPVIDVTAVAAVAREGGADIPLTGWSWDGLDSIDLHLAAETSVGAAGTWWTNIEDHVNRYRVTYSHGYDPGSIPEILVDVAAQAALRVISAGGAAEGSTQRTIGQYSEQFQQATGAPGNSPWMSKAEQKQLADAGFRRRNHSVNLKHR